MFLMLHCDLQSSSGRWCMFCQPCLRVSCLSVEEWDDFLPPSQTAVICHARPRHCFSSVWLLMRCFVLAAADMLYDFLAVLLLFMFLSSSFFFFFTTATKQHTKRKKKGFQWSFLSTQTHKTFSRTRFIFRIFRFLTFEPSGGRETIKSEIKIASRCWWGWAHHPGWKRPWLSRAVKWQRLGSHLFCALLFCHDSLLYVIWNFVIWSTSQYSEKNKKECRVNLKHKLNKIFHCISFHWIYDCSVAHLFIYS